MSEQAIRIRVQPKASANRIDGWAEDAEGHPVLKLRVTAAPDKGQANRAVIALLAKSSGLPKSSLSIIAGAKSRTKTVMFEQAPADLSARLDTAAKG